MRARPDVKSPMRAACRRGASRARPGPSPCAREMERHGNGVLGDPPGRCSGPAVVIAARPSAFTRAPAPAARTASPADGRGRRSGQRRPAGRDHDDRGPGSTRRRTATRTGSTAARTRARTRAMDGPRRATGGRVRFRAARLDAGARRPTSLARPSSNSAGRSARGTRRASHRLDGTSGPNGRAGPGVALPRLFAASLDSATVAQQSRHRRRMGCGLHDGHAPAVMQTRIGGRRLCRASGLLSRRSANSRGGVGRRVRVAAICAA